MIVTRTPLRVSFAGGGSDLPAWTDQGNTGAVISAAIDRYVYITVGRNWNKDRLRVSYSKTESVDDLTELKNTLIKSCLSAMFIPTGMEISSIAEIPSKGTGLGSSSSYAVGLIHALDIFAGSPHSRWDWLAEKACEVEIDIMKRMIGRQDQYAAACGGFNYMRFNAGGKVSVQQLNLGIRTIANLQKRLILLYTGIVRWNGDYVLQDQSANLQKKARTRDQTKKMVGIVHQMKDVLERGILDDFGCLLDEGWKFKRRLSQHISNPKINELYYDATKAGALGGKLCGAGGGGFLLFYVPNEKAKRKVLKKLKLRQIEVKYGVAGSECVFNGRGL